MNKLVVLLLCMSAMAWSAESLRDLNVDGYKLESIGKFENKRVSFSRNTDFDSLTRVTGMSFTQYNGGEEAYVVYNPILKVLGTFISVKNRDGSHGVISSILIDTETSDEKKRFLKSIKWNRYSDDDYWLFTNIFPGEDVPDFVLGTRGSYRGGNDFPGLSEFFNDSCDYDSDYNAYQEVEWMGAELQKNYYNYVYDSYKIVVAPFLHNVSTWMAAMCHYAPGVANPNPEPFHTIIRHNESQTSPALNQALLANVAHNQRHWVRITDAPNMYWISVTKDTRNDYYSGWGHSTGYIGTPDQSQEY